MSDQTPAAPAQQTLDQLGVPRDLADQARIMWLLSGLISILGPLIFGYMIKKPGQDENPWFQDQVRKCWILSIVSLVGAWCVLGWVFAVILGVMAFSQIGDGKDPKVPLLSPDGFRPMA